MSKRKSKKLLGLKKWITQTEAALLRNVSPSTISYLLSKGRLRGEEIDGRRLVFREDVLKFKPLAQGVGRPSKHMLKLADAKVDRETWITQKEAAVLRQATVDMITTAIKRGRLRILKVDGISYIYKKDVLAYKPRIDYHPGDMAEPPIPTGEDPENWISVAEAARIRGVKQTTIITHVTRKRIRSIKWGDTRLVHREDIINFKNKSKRGRPKKKT